MKNIIILTLFEKILNNLHIYPELKNLSYIKKNKFLLIINSYYNFFNFISFLINNKKDNIP